MRLADDRRARVPFALVGVVLLVGSASYGAALGTRGPSGTNAGGRAVEEATAVARTALERAVSRAAREAAADPVVTPANTSAGRVINDSTPFADYLRIRVYLAARDALDRASASVGETKAAVALSPVSDAASLRRAKRSVRIERLPGERPRIAVTFRNASIVVRRDGRVLERRRYAPTVAVETPVLAVHRRAAAFQRRLNGSPADGGLATRVTGRLAAVAWARGLAQYGGAPVANVVSNRHLEVVTNGALLDVQRSAFGRVDPAGHRARGRAAVRVGKRDILAGAANADLLGGRDDGDWTDRVLRRAGESGMDTAARLAGREAVERRRTPLTVGVNGTADTAFAEMVGERTVWLGGSGDAERSPVADAVDEVYTAEAWLRVRSRVLKRNTTGRRAPEGDGWVLTDVTNTTETTVTPASGSRLRPPNRSHRLASFARTVTVTRRVVRTWRRGPRTRRTVGVERTRHRVRIAVFGRHANSSHAPRRGIESPHRPGGPLGGRNFADVRARALDRLVGKPGLDGIARRAVRGAVADRRVTVDVAAPDGIRAWIYRDLVSLRERVRNLSVTVDRREALRGTPTARLPGVVRARRDALLDVPSTYPSVAAKARLAARARYLDAVERRLEGRATRTRPLGERLRAELAKRNLSVGTLLERLDASESGSDTGGTPVTGVRGEPPYLTASVVDSNHSGAVDGPYYPLAVRNRNLFAVPRANLAADIAKELVPRPTDSAALGTAGRSLRAANRTLRATDRTLRGTDGRHLRGRRDRLVDATGRTIDTVRGRLRDALLRSGYPATDARRAVDAGFREWETIHERALAAANGSLARAVAGAALPERASAVRRDRLRLRLRVALAAAVREAGVRTGTVGPVENATTEVARAAVAGGLDAAAESWIGTAARPSLSGLPLVPVVGWWYATLNVWTATVRGRYARFVVRAPARSPVPSRNLTYARRAGPVALDVDGDGRDERLGHNEPIAFEVRTAVPVVVPPGPPGVGDGTRVERSKGWPAPGPE